jgi:hypothetical protein
MWDAWERGEVFTGVWLGGPNGRDHWEDLDVGGSITLGCTLGRKESMGQTGFGWLRTGSMVGFCEHGNEPSCSVIMQDIF